MFQFKRDFTEVYAGSRSLEESRRLNPRLESFAQWLAANAEEIPIPD